MNSPVRAANTFLKKITPKTVCDAIGFDLLNLQRPVAPRHLYDLYGIIRDATVIPDKSGQGRKDSIRLRGRFQAVTQEGIEFDSPVTYIPGGMDDVLFEVLREAHTNNPEAVIHTALSIGIKTATPGKPSATGYEFDVQRITAQETPQPDDPIRRLREQAEIVRQARLEAPKEAEVMSKVESVRHEASSSEVSSEGVGEAVTGSDVSAEHDSDRSSHKRGRHRP